MGVGRRDLTDVERESIMREILLRSSGAVMTRMPKGFGEMLADKYGCHVTTIRKVLARAKEEERTSGQEVQLYCSRSLGFFAAIQSLQHRQSAKSIDELVVNVINAFETYPFEKLNNAFITLQCCMIEAIKCNGDNTYKIPHMSKEKLSRLGMLPEKVPCDEELFRVALTCLDAHDQEEMTKILQAEVETALKATLRIALNIALKPALLQRHLLLWV
ncbi:hypothetical protein AeRB84_007962 [Aphanomyces euteiches]|nr:hypothetical protein AeRB84_007962 [Aphanomyces euteiches]